MSWDVPELVHVGDGNGGGVGGVLTFQPNFMVRSLHSRLLSLLLIITNGVE